MSVAELDPERLVRLPLISAAADDRYFDYCLEPYTPRRPWQGKIRAENLLWDSLHVGGCRRELTEPLRAVQASLGRDMTVWGIKWDGEKLFWELYFYDPQKEDPATRVTSLAETLRPWIDVAVEVRESIPYVMASLDLSKAIARDGRLEEVNLYLTGQEEHAGRSYKLRADRVELENTYRFFEAKRQVDGVLALLKASYFVDYSDPPTLSKVLIPELFACKKICVSKKRTCDAIYFSGITVEQLLWFLQRFSYPAPLVEFVKEHQEELTHLYFDVGIDYRMDPATGKLVFPKSSYYGTL